jgi:uncharacterized membrane protein
MAGGNAAKESRGQHRREAEIEFNPDRREAQVEFNRIVAFSDGVFAIAITLLVLNLEITNDVDLSSALIKDSNNFVAYGISFAVLGRFWLAHHSFFAEVERFSHGLMVLNLFYLAWVALVPFASGVLGDFSGTTAAVAVYAIILAALSLSEELLGTYSARAGLMTKAGASRQQSGGLIHRFLIPATFLLAIPVALFTPDNAAFVWLLVFPVSMYLNRRRRFLPI